MILVGLAATIALSGCTTAASGANTNPIKTEEAKQIALDHASVAAADVTFLRADLSTEDGRKVFDIEFYNGAAEYDYEIDAVTGDILSSDMDIEDYIIPKPSSSSAGSSAVIDRSNGAISIEKAKEIALAHAGVAAADVSFVRAEQDRENGKNVFDIEFYQGNTEYDYEIDVVTGDILSYDTDIENYANPTVNPAPVSIGGASASTTAPTQSSQYIGEEKAKSIALAKAPGATLSNIQLHLEYDDGIAVYEGTIVYNEIKYEFDIRATDGAIISWESESVYDD